VAAHDAAAGTSAGIDPADLAHAMRVLAAADELPAEHPDAVALRRAAARTFKRVKEGRRVERQTRARRADAAVTAATATAAPGRVDDETRGLLPAPRASGEPAGRLVRARSCYTCKTRYVDVDAFYHQLCPPCAAVNRSRRHARTDLRGRRALLTGGRAKIGMYIALRLLRDGAHTTITTRFPHDAVRRFTAMEDSSDWVHRLTVVGVDLRDPAQVVALADSVAAAGPLDILINNAAQTVRRSPGAYAPLVAAESLPLPPGPLPELLTFDHVSDAHPASLAGALTEHPTPHGETGTGGGSAGHDLTVLALTAGSASPERISAGTAIDAGGLVPDLLHRNSWTRKVDEVDPLELLEVQLCNSTAPFLLLSRLRASLASSPARRSYVVNVSAMEGQFARAYKGPGHPHTNMAKAALNMLTRTSSRELLETDGILMTAVDTGWITDERPHHTRVRLAQEGFHAPLDLVDGAARVYDPIVQGELGVDLHGCFLKDYAPASW